MHRVYINRKKWKSMQDSTNFSIGERVIRMDSVRDSRIRFSNGFFLFYWHTFDDPLE